jgi:hypothetical protein
MRRQVKHGVPNWCARVRLTTDGTRAADGSSYHFADFHRTPTETLFRIPIHFMGSPRPTWTSTCHQNIGVPLEYKPKV